MGMKRGSRCIYAASQSHRTGILVYVRHPLYKIPQPLSPAWKKDRGGWGKWRKAAVICDNKSFPEALLTLLGKETAELISQGWISLERILPNPQKTPQKLGKGMARWGALFGDTGLSDWVRVSDDI